MKDPHLGLMKRADLFGFNLGKKIGSLLVAVSQRSDVMDQHDAKDWASTRAYFVAMHWNSTHNGTV